MSDVVQSKLERLMAHLRPLGSAVVAYSGGVDSSLLLKVAVDTLGKDALGLLAVSPSLPAREKDEATALAAHMGATLQTLETRETQDPQYMANAANRCFHCKDHVYAALRTFAGERGIPHILDGMNADDTLDIRPGRAAALRHGVRSPLFELGFTKAEVREAARLLGLPNWDKPAAACLASRIPYGTSVTEDLLSRIESAEEYLKSLGFPELRVRHHGIIARVEIPDERLMDALALRDTIAGGLQALGWLHVTLDLQGLQHGSMNKVLKKSKS